MNPAPPVTRIFMRAIIQKSSDPFPAMAAQRKLRIWYRRHRRDLAWRRTRDPYRIWISEVMLQQTTVKTVMPYYEAFVAAFPDLPSLAGAAEEKVLALWSGLGYYHRARNLHRGARHVLERHRGRWPRPSSRKAGGSCSSAAVKAGSWAGCGKSPRPRSRPAACPTWPAS